MSLTENIISTFFNTTVFQLFVGAVLVVLYYFNSYFRYYFKILLIGLWFTLCSSLCIPLMIFRPRNALNHRITCKWCQVLSNVLGIEWIVMGQENVSNNHDFAIVIYNHQSFLDLLAVSQIAQCFKKCTGLAKKEILYYFPLGLYYWLCGTLFIDRSKGKESFNYLNSEIKRLQKEETSLIMAPEGTRSNDITMKPFKSGAFRLAVTQGAPILPVVISPYSLLDHKNRIFNSGKVFISFLPAMETKDLQNTEEAINELKNCAWKLMNDEYTQMKSNLEKGVFAHHKNNM